jgi:hypothetical protein
MDNHSTTVPVATTGKGLKPPDLKGLLAIAMNRG